MYACTSRTCCGLKVPSPTLRMTLDASTRQGTGHGRGQACRVSCANVVVFAPQEICRWGVRPGPFSCNAALFSPCCNIPGCRFLETAVRFSVLQLVPRSTGPDCERRRLCRPGVCHWGSQPCAGNQGGINFDSHMDESVCCGGDCRAERIIRPLVVAQMAACSVYAYMRGDVPHVAPLGEPVARAHRALNSVVPGLRSPMALIEGISGFGAGRRGGWLVSIWRRRVGDGR